MFVPGDPVVCDVGTTTVFTDCNAFCLRVKDMRDFSSSRIEVEHMRVFLCMKGGVGLGEKQE